MISEETTRAWGVSSAQLLREAEELLNVIDGTSRSTFTIDDLRRCGSLANFRTRVSACRLVYDKAVVEAVTDKPAQAPAQGSLFASPTGLPDTK